MRGKKHRRYRRAGFVCTAMVLKLLSFLLTAARIMNQLIGPGQRSLIRGDCGVKRKRRSGLMKSQDNEAWRGHGGV